MLLTYLTRFQKQMKCLSVERAEHHRCVEGHHKLIYVQIEVSLKKHTQNKTKTPLLTVSFQFKTV